MLCLFSQFKRGNFTGTYNSPPLFDFTFSEFFFCGVGMIVTLYPLIPGSCNALPVIR